MALEALEKEIEDLEQQEKELQDNQQEEPQEIKEVSEEVVEEPTQEAEEQEEEKTELSEEEQERQRKQQAYRDRKAREIEERAKQEQRAAELAEQAVSSTPSSQEPSDDLEAIKRKMDEYDSIVKQQQFQSSIKQAERELAELEKPFVEAFPDYQDKVNQAIELSKLDMISQGYTEAESTIYLNQQKVLVADVAAAQGLDPVEAVYNKAKQTLGVFEKFAESQGYVKAGAKPKTNLQAQREASKPNAMTGGSSMSSQKRDYENLDMEEVEDLTLADMLKGGN